MTLVPFLHGAVSMGCAMAALFFLRFWRQARDRLFLYFAVAFVVMAADYTVLGVASTTEWRVPVFTVRIIAFLIILLGIVDKNRRDR